MVTAILLVFSAVLFTGPALFLLKRATIGRPRASGRCWRCRFDLAGLPEGGASCPECAAPRVARGQRPPMTARDRLIAASLAIILLLPVVQVGVFWRTVILSLPGGAQFLAPTLTSFPVFEAQLDGRLEAFATGGGGLRGMREAITGVVRRLSVEDDAFAGFRMDDRQGSATMSALSSDETQLVAGLLDNREIEEKRYAELIDALADAYETHPVRRATQIDDFMCAMVAGQWPRRSWSSSSDYRSVHAAPRALTDAQRERLLAMILTIQRNPTRLWNDRWGWAVESAFANGDMTADRFRQYLASAFDARVVLDGGASVRQGDAVAFRVIPNWRAGTSLPVFVRVRGATDSLAGRIVGGATVGDLTQIGVQGIDHRAKILLPDTIGPMAVDIDVCATFGPYVVDAYKAWVNPWHYANEEAQWRKFPTVTAVKRVRLDLTLAPSASAKAEETDGGFAADAVRAGIGNVYCWYDDAGGIARFDVSLELARPPIDLAGDIVLRQGTVERVLGWDFGARAGMREMRAGGPADGIDPTKPLTVVLRSRLGPIERAVWAPKVWRGEIAIESVRPRQRPLPLEAEAP